MSARLSYRIAAVVLVLFAAGHTLGFLNFQPPTAEALSVWTGMQSVHFDLEGLSRSLGGFYVGFGLSVTIWMLFAALVCWLAGGLVAVAPKAAAQLGWALCLTQIASLVLSAMYFPIEPVVFSGVLAALFAWAAIRSVRV